MSQIDPKPDVKPEDGCDGEPHSEDKLDTDSLESDINNLTSQSWRDDLALVVEDKKLYTNRLILAYASPVFNAMFSGEYKEKDAKEIPIPEKKFGDVVDFLRCITPGLMQPITMKNAFNVFPLAHEYQVKCLESACVVCFVQHLEEYPESDQVYEILENAISYGLDEVKEKCINNIAERPREEFEEAERRFKFPEDVLNMIKAKMLLNLQTKYKDVFGHVKTSRALYQFLGLEAKQDDLVKRYVDGHVVGDCVTLKVNSSLEGSTDMLIGEEKFHIDIEIKQRYTEVTVESNCDKEPIKCLVAVYVTNWMKGKEHKKQIGNIEIRNYSKLLTISNSGTDLLRNEEEGFIYKGTIEFLVYLFLFKMKTFPPLKKTLNLTHFGQKRRQYRM